MAVEGFPRLEKAFVFVFDVDPPVEIGTISSGSNLNYVRVTGGRVTTVHNFSGPKLESAVMEGEDWISVDNDNKRFRLDVKMLITTNDNAVRANSFASSFRPFAGSASTRGHILILGLITMTSNSKFYSNLLALSTLLQRLLCVLEDMKTHPLSPLATLVSKITLSKLSVIQFKYPIRFQAG
ncbi:hypothetical protein BDZ91DRAFT_845749 [Kalaharituber pfeilii]|nr:hypothetical protein BDZ91DRAFT_845749 [Kalaharituber pfeilii]